MLPPSFGIYHGAYPDFSVSATPEWAEKITKCESIVAKRLGFVTYQNDFADGLTFPKGAIQEILDRGKVPLIRIMPRSVRTQFSGPDPVYTMERFLKGEFDEGLRQWARGAKEVQGPLMVEFGPEVNGLWYQWNGRWNGWNHKIYYGDPEKDDGPERFRDVYRRVITLFRDEGVKNITWVFHIDSQPIPQEDWNQMGNYYPGDDYIDWIGVSVFGAQTPGDWYGSFKQVLDPTWPEILALSSNRPLAILEWGVIEKPGDPNGKAAWIGDALNLILSGHYPRIRAVNYWHQRSWDPKVDHNFRLDSSPQSLAAYNRFIVDPRFVHELETTRP